MSIINIKLILMLLLLSFSFGFFQINITIMSAITESSAKSSGQTFPSSWYREPGFYEFERRAIFSQSWMLITHSLQFKQAGSYVRYETAGFPFFLIKDRQGNIQAFLNVCRHRAFPLVHQDEGKASIIACKYHGMIVEHGFKSSH